MNSAQQKFAKTFPIIKHHLIFINSVNTHCCTFIYNTHSLGYSPLVINTRFPRYNHQHATALSSAEYTAHTGPSNTEWPRGQWSQVRTHRQRPPCSHSSCLQVTAKDAKKCTSKLWYSLLPKYKTFLQFKLNYKNVLYFGTEVVHACYHSFWQGLRIAIAVLKIKMQNPVHT